MRPDQRVPQFGAARPGIAYADRPSAYLVAEREDGAILCVRAGDRLHLPGGGIGEGEGPATAALRELGEETGLTATIVRELGRANQYVVAADGRAVNKRGRFFLARAGPVALHGAPTDHEPVWLSAEEAVQTLVHDFYRWAVRRAGGRGR